MTITAAMVKELRERTGVGMMDCKKALVECDGNMDAAIEFLRKKGMATAQKKASRIAAEGLTTVLISEDQKHGAIVEVNSETDFVAKNELFRTFVADVAAQALACGNIEMETFMASPWHLDTAQTVKDALVAKVAVIGENLQIRRYEVVDSPSYVGSYIHGGGRISALVSLESEFVNDEVKSAAKDIAMQVASMSPRYITREDIPAEVLEHERNILVEQAQQDPKTAKKPLEILGKMVEGRLNKQMKDICLVDQIYFRDNEITVGKYLEQVAKSVGCPIKVAYFVRYETGEGIEKKQEDFAAEVAKQMGL